MDIRPSEIRFSQSIIKDRYAHDVHEIIDRIFLGQTSADDYLPISVAFHKGRWYTRNNRSLYVFRVLEYLGEVEEIPVRIVNENTFTRLISTENEGASVTMQNGAPTRPHSIQQIFNKRKISVPKADRRWRWDIGSVASALEALLPKGWNLIEPGTSNRERRETASEHNQRHRATAEWVLQIPDECYSEP